MERQFEVITIIVNEGYEDQIMQEARNQGATGGTIISARGTAKLDAEKHFGLSIHPEKSIMLLVVPCKIKNQIVEAIYKGFSLFTEAQGILFTMPVDEVSNNLTKQLENLNNEENK